MADARQPNPTTFGTAGQSNNRQAENKFVMKEEDEAASPPRRMSNDPKRMKATLQAFSPTPRPFCKPTADLEQLITAPSGWTWCLAGVIGDSVAPFHPQCSSTLVAIDVERAHSSCFIHYLPL